MSKTELLRSTTQVLLQYHYWWQWYSLRRVGASTGKNAELPPSMAELLSLATSKLMR